MHTSSYFYVLAGWVGTKFSRNDEINFCKSQYAVILVEDKYRG
jgi:hypothetical protein